MLEHTQDSLQNLTYFVPIGGPVRSSSAPEDQYHLAHLDSPPQERKWSEFVQYQCDLKRAQECYLKLQGTRKAEQEARATGEKACADLQEALKNAQKAHEAAQKTLEARKTQEAEMQNEQASVARCAETFRRVREERHARAEAERLELYRRQMKIKLRRRQREAAERMYQAYLPEGRKQGVQQTVLGASKTPRSLMRVQKRVLLVSFKLPSAALGRIKRGENEALAEAKRKRKRLEEADEVNQTEKRQKMNAQ